MENAISLKAQSKMKKFTDTFKRKGILMGLISGISYGVYSTFIMKADTFDPLVTATAVLAVAFVGCGLNDLFAGLWLLIFNLKNGKLPEINRTLKTFPGKMIILGAILGGPIANGAYLLGLQLAGAYAIPISATCSLFGSLFAWIFLKQRPEKRVFLGMIICVAGAIIINWVKPEGADNFTLGIAMALVAALCWGLEGVVSSFGGSMLDLDIAVNIRELVSGLIILCIVIPLVNGMPLLKETLIAKDPMIWLVLAGLNAAISFLSWYKANAMVGCAIGMSLNVTYAFWGIIFSVLLLGTELTTTMVVGSIVIVIGAITVTMNPFDLLKKGDN